MTEPNELAFPCTETRETVNVSPGMTIREYVATKIMAAYIAGSSVGIANGSPLYHESLAHDAVKATDALINELNTEENHE